MAASRGAVDSAARPGRGADGRGTILQAAAEAFMELGYDRASIDEIADRLGATKGRVYHYYRSKTDLLLDIHTEMLQLMLGEIGSIAASDRPAVERLEEMARAHARLMMDNLAFARVTLISSTRLGLVTSDKQRTAVQSIRKARTAYERKFLDLIRQAAEDGDLSDLNPEIASRAFLGTLNWVGMWFNRGSSRGSDLGNPAKVADELAAFAVNGLRSS